MRPNSHLLVGALVRPESLSSLPELEWRLLIRQARRVNLLARLQVLLEQYGLLNGIPARPLAHLVAARTVADNHERVIRWEISRIQRALRAPSVPFILLKGAAYVALDLPFAKGRLASDVDLLVAKTDLHVAEENLSMHGWERTKLNPYDQYYYRTWSHELPPLRHRERGTVIDVHHTILPPTGRLYPDPDKLRAAAVVVSGTGLRVLAPIDMVLHSVAHAFQDGDLRLALRDLVDVDGLLRHFGAAPGFWDQLLTRAEELDLLRPLYYAVRYTRAALHTPIPAPVLNAIECSRPPWPLLALMDRLVMNVLPAETARGEGFASGFSAGLLYSRAHWLRMPPWLLLRHLSRKSFGRLAARLGLADE